MVFKNIIKKHSLNLLSLLGACAGLFFTCTLLVMLNRETPSKDTGDTRVAKFNPQQIKKKKKVKKKVKKQKKKVAKKKSLKPSLVKNMNLAGVGLSSLGLLDDANSANGGDVIMTADTVDKIPEVLSRSELEYPEFALDQKITGFVKFKVLINELGEVIQTKILKSQPANVFDLVANQAIKSWKFSPAIYKESNVKVWITQKIIFSLD